ncbi:unnamed protein product [Bursaphelenchus xylophilus]|uniref:(pine wood nematode) hypothetical protein n=1 Tax=Bursaphelenchus xylophilus TaxID=6326 RepID=A0A1I7S8L6_BURXY|nr:unnamed protein product [Bursaphelenchus xylophilus]CAG9089524.1 unnamed protein product [Bursaphelenchus xylophilus]
MVIIDPYFKDSSSDLPGQQTGPIPQVDIVMPYYWTTDDTRRAILASIIPIGAGVAGAAFIARDKQINDVINSSRKPHWAIKCKATHSAIDILTAAPLGYASYLVYKNGGGFDYTDTTVALTLYGANIGLALTNIPLLKRSNFQCLFYNGLLVSGTAAATAYAFYKIDKHAGLWTLPYALWTVYYAALGYATYKLNSPNKDA